MTHQPGGIHASQGTFSSFRLSVRPFVCSFVRSFVLPSHL